MTQKKSRSPWLLYCLWFALLAILFTRPMLLRAADVLADRVGDNIYFVWMIGWVKEAILTGQNPMDVWFLNYPEGWSLASTEMTPAQLLLALPFAFIGGEVFSYNMAMLLSFVLSGLITALWVRKLTGSDLAGVLSGTIFACLPYRQAHFLIGHLNLCGTQWLVLFFWGWFELIDPGEEKRSVGSAVRCALGAGLTALTSQYYIFMMAIVAGVQLLFVLIAGKASLFKSSDFWKKAALTILIALPLLIAAEVPFLQLDAEGGMPDRDWGSARMYSAGLTDYLLPGTTHFAWGKWVGEHFNRDVWPEATLFVGFTALVLFIIGFKALRKEGARRKMLRVLLLSGILTALILSMGTDLHWNGSPVEIPLSGTLAEKFGRSSLFIPLPGLFLFKYFPFYAKLRALMRFGVFALLLVAVGAGIGFASLIGNKSAGRKKALSVAVLALVILEFYPASISSFAEVSPRAVDQWLSEQDGDGSVMRYPFELNDDQAGTYYTLTHGKPFIGGFFNAFPPKQYASVRDVLAGFPNEESLALSASLEVEYYLIEVPELKEAIANGDSAVPWGSLEELQAECEANGLTLTGDFGDTLVYQDLRSEE